MEQINFTGFKEKKLKEFNDLFTNSHPGDSGPGGNYPQEPVYELCEDNPLEYIVFIDNLMEELRQFLRENKQYLL